jgi:hypothetical protein
MRLTKWEICHLVAVVVVEDQALEVFHRQDFDQPVEVAVVCII